MKLTIRYKGVEKDIPDVVVTAPMIVLSYERKGYDDPPYIKVGLCNQKGHVYSVFPYLATNWDFVVESQ